MNTQRTLTYDATRLVAYLLLLCAAPTSGADPVWFDTAAPVKILPGDDLHAAAEYAWAVTHNDVAAFPDAWLADTQPRIVFVSISDGRAAAVTQIGCAEGLHNAVDDALRWLPDLDVKWLRLDIVDGIVSMPPMALDILPGFDRTRHGLALGRDEPLAVLPAQIIANRLVDVNRTMQVDRLSTYLDRAFDGKTFRRVRGFRFTTAAAFRDGETYHPLVAGHRAFSPATIADYRTAAAAAARYLARSVDEAGRFDYIYHPDLDEVADDYNILRHGGSAWAMLEAHAAQNDPAVLAAAERAVAYMAERLQPYDFEGKTVDVLLDDEGFLNIGANGLLVLAAAEHARVTGDKRFIPVARRAAEFLLAVQAEDGRYRLHRSPAHAERIDPFVSPFYPGEVNLALCRLAAVDNDPRWLDAAARNALYLINGRDQQLARLFPDHWFLHALRELQPASPHRDYPLHALRLAQVCMNGQLIAPDRPDWLGGYGSIPNSTGAACRVEGLGSACLMLGELGDTDIVERIRAAARLGADFVLRNQFHPEQAMFYPDPQRILGAVPSRMDEPEIRIDYCHHAIIAWLRAGAASDVQ